MKLACIVLAYNLPGQLAQLLRAMTHPDVRLYVHVDQTKAIEPFHAAVDTDVTWLQRHPSWWGSAECVDAALEGLQAGLADDCDYFILISGQDFPLRPVGEIVEFFEDNRERSFLEHWPVHVTRHADKGRLRTDFYAYTVRGRREVCLPRGEDTSFYGFKGRVLNWMLRARSAPKGKRRFPGYVSPYAGTTWWNMNADAARHVLGFVRHHPDYRRYHQHTWIPEEIFFNSILVGGDYQGEVVNDSLRYFRWGEGRSPVTLTAEDLPMMLSSGKLLARKFVTVPDELVLPDLSAQRS